MSEATEDAAGRGSGNTLNGRQTRVFRRSSLVLAAMSALPILLFTAFVVDQRERTLDEGEASVERTVRILEEHALRVFEAQQLIIEQTDQYLGSMGWSDIRTSEQVHRFLQRTAGASPHVDGLWLIPPDGRTANSADFFPFPDVSVTDRRYFQVLKERNELHFGEMIVGRTKGTLNFNISRRRSPRDTFNGIILVTSSLDYFTDFWEEASDGAFVAGIFRKDGEILARYPAIETLPERLSPSSPLLARMEVRDQEVYRSTSSLDGRTRIYGYSRIGGTPLFIGYGVPASEVLAGWWREMLPVGLIALLASAFLGVSAATIVRQNRRLAATATSWRKTAQDLEQEVDRRLRAEDVAAERKRLLDEVGRLTAQRQSILENMAEGVIALDARGRIIYANPEATKLLGPFREGEDEFASLLVSGRISLSDGAQLDPALGPHRAPLAGKDLPETEFLVKSRDGYPFVCLFRGGSIAGPQGQPEGAVLTFWDITERKRDLERQNLLMRELDHRVRNMLATIKAMIRVTNDPGQSKEAFITALLGRVRAMARTHGILSEGRWTGATMGRLVDEEVSNVADARQLVTDGDRGIVLPPKEAADLTLALHELATNAVKYGAWSVPEGKVVLRWETEASAQGRGLRVEWKETGGPPIEHAPDRTGFGSTLLRGMFADGGGVALHYEREGLQCVIRVSMRNAGLEHAESEAAAGGHRVGQGEASLEGLRVLVVEDEPIIRLDLMQMLQDCGASVVGDAGSLAEGLKLAEEREADVAVLDRNLVGESSMPLARMLSRRGVGIVFASGYGSFHNDDEDLGPGHVWLQKPITRHALVQALTEVRQASG